MMTIGYGDIYPQTHFGRFVAICACLIGMLLVSTLVLALSSHLEFTGDEARAYSKIKSLHSSEEVKQRAGAVIAAALIMKKEINSMPHQFASRLLFLRRLRLFNDEHISIHSKTVPPEQMLKNLDAKLSKDLREMKVLQEETEKIRKAMGQLQNMKKNMTK